LSIAGITWKEPQVCIGRWTRYGYSECTL